MGGPHLQGPPPDGVSGHGGKESFRLHPHGDVWKGLQEKSRGNAGRDPYLPSTLPSHSLAGARGVRPDRAQRGPFRLPGFLRAPRPLIRDHVLLTVGTQQELLTSVVSHLASEALDHCRQVPADGARPWSGSPALGQGMGDPQHQMSADRLQGHWRFMNIPTDSCPHQCFLLSLSKCCQPKEEECVDRAWGSAAAGVRVPASEREHTWQEEPLAGVPFSPEQRYGRDHV
ncbi:uncharacterized protein LOC105236368 [Ailuropoda melanoleuca]|uniref:uncharacterized protein LOC105236368 n=1 Tax=Ailuropoda melanoleuca TaxID=9646 RepID=UPI001493F47B|nr:uncharacterized protein LOC105236368 [Ailuropoda melanoleuca]